MHGRLYTEDHARRLVPILRSILIEVSERAQAIAGMRPAGGHQVGQQRPGLLRRGQRQGLTAARDLQRAQ